MIWFEHIVLFYGEKQKDYPVDTSSENLERPFLQKEHTIRTPIVNDKWIS